MRPRRLAALLVGVAAVLAVGVPGAAPAAAAPRWSYSGADGPDRWASLSNAFATCSEGRQQSPIDLAGATLHDLANPQLAYQPTAARMVDNGHTVQVDLEPGSVLTLDGVPYALAQFHFHSPSEHTINGNSYAVEVQLVHQADSGALAIVGVLIAGGAENPALVPLIGAIPGKVGRDVRLRDVFDPAGLLPEDRRAYRYPGSLTTPPCTEGVSWVVMATPIQASGPQIAALARALHGNSRPPQARGDRQLVLDSTP
jgi:carbonic anhydrase